MTSKNITRNDFLRLSAGFVGVSAIPFTFGCPSDDTTDDGADSGNVSTTDTPPGTSTTDTPETSTTDTPETSTGPLDGSSSSDSGPLDGSSSSSGSTGGDSTTGEPGACEADPDVVIGTNHGHELVVPLADVMAAVEVTYNIQGTSMHSHEVTLTAADFAMLQAGMVVMVTSSQGAMHDHAVTVSCGA
jgi:hypothetical protein